jgi:Uma2 family endonuclease
VAAVIAANLLVLLSMFVKPRKLSIVSGADGEFNFTQPGETLETALAPDVAFVHADRVPLRDSVEYKKAPRLAPDLVAEVVSPNQYRPEMAAKARLYLERGVRLVWIVWPDDRQADLWRPTPIRPSRHSVKALHSMARTCCPASPAPSRTSSNQIAAKNGYAISSLLLHRERGRG